MKMTKRKLTITLILLSALLCSCAGASDKSTSSAPAEVRRVIIDTDTGGDDALAILMAAKDPNIKIEGVTVLAGNVPLEQAENNVLMTLETAGCDAKVYPGAKTALDDVERETFSVYGNDGMGDKDLIHPSGKPEEKDAVDFILETVKASPNEIEIIAIGPATNIATAIKKDPETMSKVKRIWSMGTAGLGEGNATPVAEFNVYKDAEAYKIMLDSGIPITITGLDMCENKDAVFTSDDLKKMENGNDVQRFSALAFSKLLEFRQETQGVDNVDICDAISMANVLWPDFTGDKISCRATCITEDCEAFGEVIFYRTDITYDTMPELGDPNVELIISQNYKDLYKRVNELLISE